MKLDKINKLAIMQPYFLPYIGYFQLIAAVDVFVIYDNIKYTKKGWINRNRILLDGKETLISLPLKKGSDYLNVCERTISSDFNRNKILDQIKQSYKNAPNFSSVIPIIEDLINYPNPNLFDFIFYSVIRICEYLEIKTKILVSSSISCDHSLKGQDKVIAICEALDSHTYINAIGGTELYSKATFENKNIDLYFLQAKPFHYQQFQNEFIPWLSILDVMMFVTKDKIQKQLTEYSLI